jgi:hypothetical protein
MDVVEEAGPALVDILGTKMEVDDEDDETWFEDCEGLRPKKKFPEKEQKSSKQIVLQFPSILTLFYFTFED